MPSLSILTFRIDYSTGLFYSCVLDDTYSHDIKPNNMKIKEIILFPGKLYAIGGSSGSSELKSGECFDPETKEWSKISDMSICRSNFDVCVLGGKLFAVGGNDGRHALESVEVFDPGGYHI